MIQEDAKTDFGSIKIHNNVLSSIASIAVNDVEGVSRISENIVSKLLKMLGKKTQGSSIDIKTDKDENGITITIPIIVKYGYNIPDVAMKVQEKVKSSIEETTELNLKDIIVKIKGVEK